MRQLPRHDGETAASLIAPYRFDQYDGWVVTREGGIARARTAEIERSSGARAAARDEGLVRHRHPLCEQALARLA